MEDLIFGADDGDMNQRTPDSPIAELFAEVLDGRHSLLTDGVERALGRPARDFTDDARTAAATGVWNEAMAS